MKENKSSNNRFELSYPLYPYKFKVYDKPDINKQELPPIYAFERFDFSKYQPVQGRITTSTSQ